MNKQLMLSDLGDSRISKCDRLDMIFGVLADMPNTPLAARDIARAVGLKNSAHVRRLLGELVDAGDIETDVKQEIPNIKPTRFWWYNSAAWQADSRDGE